MDEYLIKKIIRYVIIGILIGVGVLMFLLGKKLVKVGTTQQPVVHKNDEVETEEDLDLDNVFGISVETESMTFNEELDEEKPGWLDEDRVSNIDIVTSIYNEKQDRSMQAVNLVDDSLEGVINHIEMNSDSYLMTIEYPDYDEINEGVASQGSDFVEYYMRQNSIRVQNGFTDEDSLHLFTDFKDKIWFDFYKCLCAVYFFDDTKVVYIPYNTYMSRFENLKELVVVDYKDFYLDKSINTRALNLGDVVSFGNGLVGGTYLEDYEDYKILYINKNSINIGDNIYFE